MTIRLYHRPRKTRQVEQTLNLENGDVIKKLVTIEDEPITSFKIEDTDEAVILHYKTKHRELPVEGTFTVNKAEWAGKIMECTLIQTDVPHAQVMYELYHRIDFDYAYRRKPRAKEDNVLAKFCFEENGDINVFLFHRIDNVDGFENIILKEEEGSSELLYRDSPLFRKTFDKNKAKGEMMRYIDIFASFAYFEVQIDALTDVVLKIAEKEGIESDSVKILKTAQEQSVLKMKSLESCLEEINTYKKNVRDRQKTYFKARYGTK